MSVSTYPVRVDATLEERLSRWLWLVKWLLVIPHFLVLALLWLAFVVLSAIAFVAILVTGRYPRRIFEFNVGVLRWSWRVAYYAYGGLATDRYPPFSLHDDPSYPAHLEIEYPDRLSRGLVLVKWWLLAIPHYLVVGLFLGSGWYVATNGDDIDRTVSGFGLIGLLVLVAAVVLLATGRYPRPIFELVLGLNRWVLRVAAYAALMTDAYPPFRLDMGGTDPGTSLAPSPPDDPGVTLAPAGSTDPSGPVPQQTSTHWGVGRITATVVGSLLALSGAGMLASGAALMVVDNGLRDDDGYLMSPSVRVDSPGYAVTSGSFELHAGVTAADLPNRWLGTVRVEVDGDTPNGTFVGIARTDDVARYLDGVATSVVVAPGDGDGEPTLEFTDGGSPRVSPSDADFWAESASGPGTQTLTWAPESGDWTLVVMNGEGTTPVRADVAVGATAPVLDDVAGGLLVAGLLAVGLATALLVGALRRSTAERGA